MDLWTRASAGTLAAAMSYARALAVLCICAVGAEGVLEMPISAPPSVGVPPAIYAAIEAFGPIATWDLLDPVHGGAAVKAGIEVVKSFAQQSNFVPRYHLAEIFSGKGELTRQAASVGLKVMSFDVKDHRSMNIAQLPGFIFAAIIVMMVVPCGVVWIAPQCSSWLPFISSFHMRRREDNGWTGNLGRKDVREANLVANIVCWLAGIAHVRGCYTIIENPVGSNFFKCFPVRLRGHEMSAQIFNTWGGAFGWSTLKGMSLYSTVPSQLMFQYS